MSKNVGVPHRELGLVFVVMPPFAHVLGLSNCFSTMISHLHIFTTLLPHYIRAEISDLFSKLALTPKLDAFVQLVLIVLRLAQTSLTWKSFSPH